MREILLIALIGVLYSCGDSPVISNFEILEAKVTNISFSNQLNNTEDFNILEYLYFYNGAGVATGDVNNDGLADIFFGSNQGLDQLYLNKGDFQFENASHLFDQIDLQGWTTGVNLVDVNCDGWLDVYVCRLGDYKMFKDHNRLFINNEGNSFTESSKLFGLDFSGFSTHSSFFDYDNDGDLDCYLLNHSVKDPAQFKPSKIRNEKDTLAGDRLLENQGGRYVDVTSSAGVFSSNIGFGLGVAVADINDDGWQDIYIGNDFHEQDYLYLNNKDKTFREISDASFGHTSNFSMGCAIGDLNHDLLPDIFTLDMQPDDDKIFKKSGGWENMQIYDYKRSFGYGHQSPRNALQIQIETESELPVFSEQAALHGMEATDWSWSPLVADFNNDGQDDIFVANGIVRRPNDLDFINFEFDNDQLSILEKIDKMPRGDISNVVFLSQTKPESTFHRSTIGKPGCSTAAAFADFNKDGSLDVVLNNLNGTAQILKNTIGLGSGFIQIRLIGTPCNRAAIGAKVYALRNGERTQIKMLLNANGFQSASEPILHFGLKENDLDRIEIVWPDGTHQIEKIPVLNKLYTIQKNDSTVKPEDLVRIESRRLDSLDGFTFKKKDFDGQLKNKWLLFDANTKDCGFTVWNDSIFITQNMDVLAVINEDLSSIKDCKRKYVQAYYDSDLKEDKQLANSIEVDLDDNGVMDIVAAGLWSPIRIFMNIATAGFDIIELENTRGLWGGLEVVDIDDDGDLDIIAGNFGVNHRLDASEEYPIQSYTHDFDRNGLKETLISYVADGIEVPYPNQELFVAQLPIAKKKFLKAERFVDAGITELLTRKDLHSAKKSRVDELRSCYFINNGGKGDKLSFDKKVLPKFLQVAPIFAIEHDGDALFYFGGNLFDVDPNWGRQDAGYLSVAKYADGKFKDCTAEEMIPYINGEIRDLHYHDEKLLIAIRGEKPKVLYLKE